MPRKRDPEDDAYYQLHPWRDERSPLAERWAALRARPLATEHVWDEDEEGKLVDEPIHEPIPPERVLAVNYREHVTGTVMGALGSETRALLRDTVQRATGMVLDPETDSGFAVERLVEELDDRDAVRFYRLLETAGSLVLEALALLEPPFERLMAPIRALREQAAKDAAEARKGRRRDTTQALAARRVEAERQMKQLRRQEAWLQRILAEDDREDD